MALFVRGQECPLCGQPMADTELFGTWGVWLPADDPLWRFCDATMHWDCYASWPHRPRFASTYFDFWVSHEERNPFWRRGYLDNQVLVTVNPHQPVEAAWVYLKETGSRHQVKLKVWEAWLAAEPEAALHPVLAEAVRGAKRVLRRRFPDGERLLAGTAEEERRDDRLPS